MKRLDTWEDIKYGMLMEDTLCMCAQYLTVACREDSEEHQAQAYHTLVLQGKMRMVVQWIT